MKKNKLQNLIFNHINIKKIAIFLKNHNKNLKKSEKKSNTLWVKNNYKAKFLTNSILKKKINKYNFRKKK